jgi:hypothetical protein
VPGFALGLVCLSAEPHDVVTAGSFYLWCLSGLTAWAGAGRFLAEVTRGNAVHLGGRSVACDRSGDCWMRAVRRGLTIGNDRPVIAQRSDGVSFASLGVKSDGDD